MIHADPQQFITPPPLELFRPAIIRPAEQTLLRPGAFRPVTRTERREIIADLVRTKRLTFEQAKKAFFFVPVVFFKIARPPTVVGTPSTYFDTTQTNSYNVPLPSGLISGNLGLIFLTGSAGGTYTTSTPLGWTSLGTGAYSGGTAKWNVFYKTLTGSEGSTVTIGAGTSSWDLAVICYQITGWSGTPIIGTASTGTTTSPNPPSATPTAAASLAFAICGGNPSSTQTVSAYPTGYSNGTTVFRTSGAGRVYCIVSLKNLSGTSAEDPSAYSVGQSSPTWAQTVIVSGA
jgi:hypothetical protein